MDYTDHVSDQAVELASEMTRQVRQGSGGDHTKDIQFVIACLLAEVLLEMRKEQS